MRLIIAVLLFLTLATAPVLGAEEVLQLKSGKLAVGEIKAVDAKGVTLVKDGHEAHYDWSALTPICQYEVRADRVEPEDAKGHFSLGEFCLHHGLYTRARGELDTARGVGYADLKKLTQLLEVVTEAEADAAFAQIDHLVAEEEYQLALEEIRRFLVQAPQSDHTRRARARVADLLRRIDSQALRDQEALKAAQDDRKAEQVAKRLAKLLETAGKYRAIAAESYAEASRYHQIGNVTRSRKAYEKAEEALLRAHRALREVQKTSREGVATEKAAKDRKAIRAKLVSIYLGLASLYLDDRNYKRGVPYVNRVLYLDPVNEDALDMRREVDANRIRRRLSGLSNAYPRGG